MINIVADSSVYIKEQTLSFYFVTFDVQIVEFTAILSSGLTLWSQDK